MSGVSPKTERNVRGARAWRLGGGYGSGPWEQEPDMAYDPPYASPYILRSSVGSSHYSGTLLYQAPAEDFLAQRVAEMG